MTRHVEKVTGNSSNRSHEDKPRFLKVVIILFLNFKARLLYELVTLTALNSYPFILTSGSKALGILLIVLKYFK